ncbi:GNAT family N-acetyltransferase [Halorarum halophilum]|uniref:GNAT family N-acetyltransferase n=1 Tax=Halorarum halophilum TaxID=2743090 RepID=A0A7D5KHT9_9EURY|nr:GNAT family N-acetyltransferase [Halobaculum halophilum]QLG29476.1 GNAT family N-acetyltransferase [Halobaculum halophilum]
MPGGEDDADGGAEPASSVEIRPATRADLLDVFRIEKAVFEQPWPFAAFERLLEAPAFLVADVGETGLPAGDDGVAAGNALGYVVADVTPNHGRDIGHVKDIAVRPGAQGRGLGRRLLRESLGELAAAGAAVVKLEVRESNHRAQSLYADEGFEPARRIQRYYADGEAAFVMALDLNSWPAERA